MKEIGGYFGLEDLMHKEYYTDVIAFNTARNALLYLVQAYNMSKIYIPYYLCDCIQDTMVDNGVSTEKYHVGDNFEPLFAKELGESEYILIVNFYGQIHAKKAKALQNKYNNVILDNTQAFFQQPIKSMPTIYSCRKFFGVPDGAYLTTEIILSDKFETDISKDRMQHILGRFEGNASDYYSDFKKNDADLANEPIKLMSKLTRNLMGAINYQKVIAKRNGNFKYLHDKLRDLNQLNLSVPTGPFAYPFYTEKAPEIRKRLAEKKIYIPVLWPNVLEDQGASELEHRYAECILPIPCDQRYDSNDLNRIIKEMRV